MLNFKKGKIMGYINDNFEPILYNDKGIFLVYDYHRHPRMPIISL